MGAYFLVDMAHISGLVATGLYPSPVPYADVVTSTTHKTLRGPRSGIILARQNETLQKKLNSAVFPGSQGGPLMHVIAAKAVCFKEAMEPAFQKYMQQVVDNAKTMCDVIMSRGVDVVTGTYLAEYFEFEHVLTAIQLPINYLCLEKSDIQQIYLF